MKKLLFILLSIFILNTELISQQAIELPGSAGTSLDATQMKQLEDIAVATAPSFNSTSSFTVFDCSFYTFNDEMGAEQENEVWEGFQKKAKTLGKNHILLGRQYFEGQSGFKLWIHLEVDIEDLECYSSDDKSEIVEYIQNSRDDIEEWYEYLSINNQTNNFQIQVDIADLAFHKMDKICCLFSGTRNDCDPDALNPQEIQDETNLKYYIIGQLQCLLFYQGNSCNSNFVSSGEGLGALTSSNFKENSNSNFVDDDILGIGKLHIYMSDEYNYQINCNVQPQFSTRQHQPSQGVYEDIDVKEYDLGRFTIVIEKEKDLYEILKKLNHESNSLLPAISNKLKEGTILSDNEKAALLFSSYCNFDKLNDHHKIILLDLVTDEFDRDLWELWRWFQPRYPLFVRQLYDGISDKRLLFEEQEKDISFALRLIDYKFSDAIKNQEFYEQYLKDYISLLTLSNGHVRFKGEYMGNLLFLPYSVEKTLAWHFTQLGFKTNDSYNNKIDIIYSNPNWYNDLYLFGPPAQDPFTPVYIEQINFPGFTSIDGIVPLVFLLNLNNHLVDDAAFTTIMSGVDVISTVSLIGNIGKFRHLGRVKVFFSGVEISSSIGSQMLTYTSALDNHPDLKRKIQLILAAIEISSAVGNGITPSDIKKIQEEALDASKKLDDLAADADDPKTLLSSHLRMLVGGKQALIDRIKDYVKSDFISYIESLDDANDAAKIARFHTLADSDAIRQISNHINPTNYTKFGDDLVDQDFGLKLVVYLRYQNPKGVKAWNALKKTGLRTDVDLWLPTVSKWLDEGVTFVDDVLPVKFLHNGDEIARIVDDKLVPTKFQFDGTVINEVKLPGQTFGKDVVKASDGTIGFRYQFQKTKIYRAMSDAEWQAVQSNNGLSIGSGTENFVSTSKAYSEGYIGQPGYDVLVEFTVQPKTVQDLAKIGVKDQSNLIKNSGFDDLTPVSSGWSSTKALFKGEGTAVNIGLGAESVNTFNGNIANFVRLN